MRKQQTSDYIELGIQIRFLMAVWAGSRIHGPAGVSTALARMYDLFDGLGLTVSGRLAGQLGLDDIHERLGGADADAVLDEADAKRLRENAGKLGQTVMAESSGLFAYVTEEKRLDRASAACCP